MPETRYATANGINMCCVHWTPQNRKVVDFWRAGSLWLYIHIGTIDAIIYIFIIYIIQYYIYIYVNVRYTPSSRWLFFSSRSDSHSHTSGIWMLPLASYRYMVLCHFLVRSVIGYRLSVIGWSVLTGNWELSREEWLTIPNNLISNPQRQHLWRRKVNQSWK